MNTVEATADLKEAVGEAIDSLPLEDRAIFELLFIAHMSLRVTEKVVGIPKTSLARRRDMIRRRLMLDLSQDKRVQKWMYRDF
jgi:DNA-directed RNA polymerase specialized sigma24 family protein